MPVDDLKSEHWRDAELLGQIRVWNGKSKRGGSARYLTSSGTAFLVKHSGSD